MCWEVAWLAVGSADSIFGHDHLNSLDWTLMMSTKCSIDSSTYSASCLVVVVVVVVVVAAVAD